MGKLGLGCLAVLIVVVLIVGISFAGTYNRLVTLGQDVDTKWAQVENQYQRRADLVPNLVATVQGAAQFEKATLEAVTQARASVARAQINPGAAPTDPAQLEGTENRIAVARMDFNSSAQAYNTARMRFPTNLIAGMLGFKEKPYFKATPGSEKPPAVQFNFGATPAAPAKQ